MHRKKTISDLLDISVVIYLKDILVFSKNLDEHQHMVQEVFGDYKNMDYMPKNQNVSSIVNPCNFWG